MTVEIIRVDGSRETRKLAIPRAFDNIEQWIGAQCCTVVNLRDGRVMILDDTGMIDGKPINPEASKIYHAVYDTPFSIHGDVVIAVDEDFA